MRDTQVAGTALSLRNVCKRFGKTIIANDLSMDCAHGELVGVIGPNGAGKSTLFNLISGDIAVDSGEIEANGQIVTALKPFERNRLGVARSYQVPKPFGRMSVAENLEVSAIFGAGLRRSDARSWVDEVLSLSGLQAQRDLLAGSLPLLVRKRLELARAVATKPAILLLDEIAGGLTDAEVDDLVSIIRAIASQGVTILWVEHVLRALTKVADRVLVLHGGTWIADGAPEAVMIDPEVQRIYFGAVE
ncbi:ABC transporter ATP-binding protein [uncultured Tateyamaria sp.]|uniref:ABC transporter ATP-binding protein n=1 Tax=uncultured Tateyamaria sp. TaxID=455651 RepID=UPI002601B6B7|nr:ABC transporter ATP-binding protein [uncultured Tateyamaria sp.]